MKVAPATALSAVWFAGAPGIVAGLVPWLLTGWHMRGLESYWLLPVRAIGALLIAAGAAAVIHAFVRFVREGLGTPVPIAPPQHLVVGGLYRYVRNPMYVAVVAAIVGQALLLVQLGLFWYAAVVVGMVTAFVYLYEEPALGRRFGESYQEYRRAVPRWWPRLSPWQPPPTRAPKDS